MSPDPERIEALLLKFIHDDLSEQEQIELKAYVNQAPWLKKLYEELQEDPFLTSDIHTFSRIPLQVPRIQDLETRQQADHLQNPAEPFRIKRGMLAGCAALLLLVVSAYVILHFYNGDVFENRTPRYKSTIAAGTDRAILTTGNGQSFVLEADSDELVANRKNVRIKKLADGTLVYQAGPNPGPRPSGEYNTVRTPQGGQYRVILPDSSIVRLNAVSSLRFPVVFGERERVVEVEGEAYFDIRHDPDRPFQVVLPGGAHIEVLGTSFNVKAYRDEPAIKTTLASGTIRMHSGDREILLRPGQQALLPITKPERIRLQTDINLEAEISWKDGYFHFEDMALDDIMRQIARWYDVEIVYENRISKRFNILNLSRSVPLERLLELLEMTGHVKFSIEERTVTVMR